MSTAVSAENRRSSSFDAVVVNSGGRPHLAGLDGLRGIAILLVIAHNVGTIRGNLDGVAMRLWALVSNAGWTGVELFFALSGFLITDILLRSKGAPDWLRNFYLRRALRIAPLYYLLLAFVFFIAPHFSAFEPLFLAGTRTSLWYWFYLSNWIAPLGGMPAFLPHLWSLAVEEQFYLLWPVLVALVSDRALARICVLTVVGALAIRAGVHAVFVPDVASAAAYSFTIARCDAIALGALIALTMRQPSQWDRLAVVTTPLVVIVAMGLAMIGVFSRGLDATGLSSELAAQPLVGILCALLVYVCVRHSVPAGARSPNVFVRAMSARWLTTIGKYSYALYVFHMLVHRLLAPHFGTAFTDGSGMRRLAVHLLYTLIVFVVSMVLALLSWRIIEHPFLSLKRFFPMRARGTPPLAPFGAPASRPVEV